MDSTLAQTGNDSVTVHIYTFCPRGLEDPMGGNWGWWNWAYWTDFIRTDYAPLEEDDRYVKNLWYFQRTSLSSVSQQYAGLWYTFFDSWAPNGNGFSKYGWWQLIAGQPGHVQIPFFPGAINPNMFILGGANIPEINPLAHPYQTIQLHPGWNLVSWNIKITDPEPVDPLLIDEVVGCTGIGGPSIAYMFGPPDHEENMIFPWNHKFDMWYPAYPNQITWDRNLAYYIRFDSSLSWYKSDSTFTFQTFELHPDSAWSNDFPLPDGTMMRWVFIGYPSGGYQKLASIPCVPHPRNGNPHDYSFEGPFHWLIWDSTNNDLPYVLKIVRDDQGKYYLPNLSDPAHPVDQIGVLEPGHGYFLGFYCGPNRTFDFTWSWSPIWTNQSVDPPLATSHFQFKPYTHWCYPVLIDTIDVLQTPLEIGDELAVFDGDLCVGAVRYEGTFPILLNGWEDDISTPDSVDGYNVGHEMSFKWFDVSENAEAVFTLPPTTYGIDDPVTPSHSGFGCGAYGIRSFWDGVVTTLQLPKEFKLGQNYPNPFNAETIIPLELPQRSNVKVELYNVRGQNLGIIFQGVKEAGWPKIRYNASRLSSGLYFCRVTVEGLERSGKFQGVSKMVLLK